MPLTGRRNPVGPGLGSVKPPGPLKAWGRGSRLDPGAVTAVPIPVLGVDVKAKVLGFLDNKLLEGVAGISASVSLWCFPRP